MKKKARKGSWKFSVGGSAMFFMLMLLLMMWVMLHALLRREPSDMRHWAEKIVLVLFEGALAAGLWFCGLKPLSKGNLWRSARTWYEGFAGFGALFFFYGLVEAMTGRSASRYDSHPVPRSDSIYYFIFASPFIIIAVAVFLLSKVRRITK